MTDNSRPLCYSCRYRHDLPWNTHSRCAHPAVQADSLANDPLAEILALMGRRVGGVLFLPTQAAEALHIEAEEHGVMHGWFMWPLNFDPVWLRRCDGYLPREREA
jgi:hypothetical protein